MKRIILILCLIGVGLASLLGQAPEAFNYQAVIRDADGKIISNTDISLRIKVLADSPTGTVVYSEIHNVTTNQFGLVNLEIGNGIIETGTFSGINWHTHSFYVQVELSNTSGTEYQVIGRAQLLSVPYALYAKAAGSGSGFSGSYNDLTDKPTLFSGSYTDLTNKPTIPTNLNQITPDAGNRTITTVATPVNNTDAANKAYVDALLSKIEALERQPGFLKDCDGNLYTTIKIGKQVWMGENLKTKHYANGDSIGSTYPANTDITGETNPKYHWPCQGNENYVLDYGRLYTWYVATDSRNICPVGWHLPSDDEWKTLADSLGGTTVAGGKMKVPGIPPWMTPNTNATNSSGFTGLPAGDRTTTGSFLYLTAAGIFWSSTSYTADYAWYHFLNYSGEALNRQNTNSKKYGHSVRCIRD